MRKVLDSEEFQFRFDAGLAVPSSSLEIGQISDIVHSLVMHYLVFSCKAELDQLKQGLAELGVLQVMHTHPALFKPLFLAEGRPKLTADSIADTFHVYWSPQGSNQREDEEAVILGWMEYLHGLKGMKFVLCVCVRVCVCVCVRVCECVHVCECVIE